MATLHWASERGDGPGGLARAIIGALLAQGHTLQVSVRDPVAAARALGGLGLPLRPAPVWRHRTRGLPGSASSPAEGLLQLGYVEPALLAGLVDGWRALFGSPRPDLVVAADAPTAFLAARSLGIPCASLGNGHAVPPRGAMPPMPRDGGPSVPQRRPGAEARVRDTANAVLALHGAPPLAGISDLLRGDEAFVCTWPELDAHGRDEADEPVWWGPGIGGAAPPGGHVAGGPAWPAGGRARAVACLEAGHPDGAAVLQALVDRGMATCCVLPEAGAAATPPLRHPLVHVARAPLDLSQALASADLCVCHGGDGIVAQSLLAGVPLLLLPLQAEQALVGRQIERHGLGLNAGRLLRLPDLAALVDGATAPARRAAARRFAERHAGFDTADQAARIARRLGALARR